MTHFVEPRISFKLSPRQIISCFHRMLHAIILPPRSPSAKSFLARACTRIAVYFVGWTEQNVLILVKRVRTYMYESPSLWDILTEFEFVPETNTLCTFQVTFVSRYQHSILGHFCTSANSFDVGKTIHLSINRATNDVWINIDAHACAHYERHERSLHWRAMHDCANVVYHWRHWNFYSITTLKYRVLFPLCIIETKNFAQCRWSLCSTPVTTIGRKKTLSFSGVR